MPRSARPRWRFSKDYERLSEVAEAVIYGAMSGSHAAQGDASGVKDLCPLGAVDSPLAKLPLRVPHGQIGLLQARLPAESTTVTRQ
jgi:hypothetical protein